MLGVGIAAWALWAIAAHVDDRPALAAYLPAALWLAAVLRRAWRRSGERWARTGLAALGPPAPARRAH